MNSAHDRTPSVRKNASMVPEKGPKKSAQDEKSPTVQAAHDTVQRWWEQKSHIDAWEALKTKIDEAINTMDTEYLELDDIHDLMLFRAARYAQDLLEDGVHIRDAVVTELQSQGENVELESHGDLINGRGENPVKYYQAKALVIEMVQKTIMVKQEVLRLREGINGHVWNQIMEEAYERRKQAYEKLISME